MSKILIAFSTGPDSVYLYHYLKRENNELGLCYVNHNLRNDVDKDIEFVKEFSDREKVPYYIMDLNLEKFNENSAREKRYEALEKCRIENGYTYIATGHNKNDNVETVIFRLLRGTGLDGLKGIPKKRGHIIRPILGISKEEILEYLKVNNISYRIDYTNLTNDYSRNIIRNKMMPIMKEINEGYLDNISRFITLLNEDNEVKRYIKKTLDDKNIKYSKNKIDEIYDIRDKNGAIICLDKEYIWYKSYNFYGIKKRETKKSFRYILKLNEDININGYSIYFSNFSDKKNQLEKMGYKIYNILNVDLLEIRNRKDGDYIDNIKLKKLFIDKKIDKYTRDLLPLVLANDEIILVADIRHSKKISGIATKDQNYIAIKKGE